MSQHDPDAVVERFPQTSGRFSGILGLVAAAAVFVIAVADRSTGTALGVAVLACLGALLSWAILLRPALWATAQDLVVRGVVRTDRIPFALIDKVVIGQVLAVGAGGRRYVSPAIGYSARQTVKAKLASGSQGKGSLHTHQAVIEQRLNFLAQDNRDRLGIKKGSPEQAALAADVRRTYAWPELAGVAVLVAAFVVWLFA